MVKYMDKLMTWFGENTHVKLTWKTYTDSASQVYGVLYYKALLWQMLLAVWAMATCYPASWYKGIDWIASIVMCGPMITFYFYHPFLNSLEHHIIMSKLFIILWQHQECCPQIKSNAFVRKGTIWLPWSSCFLSTLFKTNWGIFFLFLPQVTPLI